MCPARVNSPSTLAPYAKRSGGALIIVCALLLPAVFFQAAASDDASRPASSHALPSLVTNESEIAEAIRPTDRLAIDNPKAVFAYVLASLPARVKVYPTENYYYFNFLHGGVPYAGNLRLDVMDRDSGKLHFAYFRKQTPWMGTSAVSHLVLDKSEGVDVTKVGPLAYRVKNGVASVVFELNDLSHVKPPRGALLAREQYLGPVFDESGVQFFLVFDPAAKTFSYVLNETKPADRLADTSISDRIHVGMRTGFAYFDDHRAKRKLLIGVNAENERLNNQFDGPFDQLPDNFIKGESLRQAILAAAPELAGQIDRLGHYYRRGARYLIGSYIRYRQLQDLAPVAACAKNRRPRDVSYAACFVEGAVNAGQ